VVDNGRSGRAEIKARHAGFEPMSTHLTSSSWEGPCRLRGGRRGRAHGSQTALVTHRVATIGAMSCNPASGVSAKATGARDRRP
jgi:hypothetical protein